MPKPPPPRVRTAPPRERQGSIPDADGAPQRPAPPPRPKSVPREEPAAPSDDGMEFDFPDVSPAAIPAPPLRARTGTAGTDGRLSIPDLEIDQAKKNLAGDLAQVEAAMAALEGRDPTRGIEVAVARRDAERVRVELRSIVEKSEVEIERNEKRRKWLAFGGALFAVVAAAGGVKALLVLRESSAEAAALESACRAVSAPFIEAGFRPDVHGSGKPVHVAGEKGRCYVAVAASKGGPAKVRVERGAEKIEGDSAAWCSCGGAEVVVTGVGPDPVGVDVVAVAAGKVGGPDLLAAMRPKVDATLVETDDRGCAEAAIDDFVAASHPGAGNAEGELGKRMTAAGFKAQATAPASAPFLELESPEESCTVVVSDAAEDTLSLRLKGGFRPLGEGAKAIAICQVKPAEASVWRKGKGQLQAFSATLAQIGGSVGLLEALRQVGLPSVALHRADDAIAAEARHALLASGATPAHIVEGSTSLLGSPDPPFLFAFAASDGRSAPPISPAHATCSPPLAGSPSAAVCLGDRTLFEDTRGVRASRPEWLQIGADAASLEAGLQLMQVARRLHAIGLEPTPAVGAVITPTGADVTGRPNESAIVGLVVGDAPPYVQTLSNAAPWDVAGEPRVIPLAPGAKVSLVATPPAPPGKGKRALVLFRR